MPLHSVQLGAHAEESRLLQRSRSIVRDRQDLHSRTHAASRIPTPVTIPLVTAAPPHNSPLPLRRQDSGIWRRNDYNLPTIILDCIKAFSARFRGFPHGVRTVSGRRDLSDTVLQECQRRAITAFAFFEDVGDASCWWRRGSNSADVYRASSTPSDLLDDLQWRLLNSKDFNFRRLRSMRYPVLKWKIGWWIERYNVQFCRAELARLAEFINTVQSNGTAETFIGYLPALESASRPDERSLRNEVRGHDLQKRKKVKIRIGWNYVVQAWLRITDSGVDGVQEEELEYFIFPGKLRAIPPCHFSGPWTIAKVGFLMNLKQLVERRPLKIDGDTIYAGMHDAIREKNLRALEILLTYLPPEWHHFSHAMEQTNVKIFKLLFMYGGQFLPEENPQLISWAKGLRDNPNSSSRKRLLGSWLLDYLKSLTARRRSLNPIFIDGSLRDVQAWRGDVRLRRIFSDMGVTFVDSEDDNPDASQEQPSNLDHGDEFPRDSNGARAGSQETQNGSGNTTGALGHPSDSSTSAGRANGDTSNNDTRGITTRRDSDDNHDATGVYTMSDGPLEHASAHGFHVLGGAHSYSEVVDRANASTAIADHIIPPVDGAMTSQFEEAGQEGREFVSIWASGYNDDGGDGS
ncbi:hypothetical protein KEM54_006980 [Ascosphaera aggregata]|nr:hypothetical protein KEM54_006980 [Ascosphaera aggregata]